MNPHNSSTSSSSSAASLRAGAQIAGWVVAWLVVIDVAIQSVFPYPSDPKIIEPPRIASYFDYGRSVEGKLLRMTRCDKEQTAPISLSGWYEPITAVQQSPAGSDHTVTFYGMSHTVLLSEAFARLNQDFSVRSVGAPGAPPNWSAGAFDRDKVNSEFAVLGVMSVAVANLNSSSPMFSSFDNPIPYTADRFVDNGGSIKVIKPPYESFADYCETFSDPQKWDASVKQMTQSDPAYSAAMFKQDVFDHSALARLLRRAYGQQRTKSARTASLSASGYVENSEQILATRRIVQHFARAARKRGIKPVIYIVNNFGYSDHLYQALKETLDAEGIGYLNSAAIIPPADPRGYLPDSHFTIEGDEKLAKAIRDIFLKYPIGLLDTLN
jgi:hypothetical protein